MTTQRYSDLRGQHVLIEKDKPLSRENLIEALKVGRSFIGFDVLGDTSGFRFNTTNLFENGAHPNHGGVRIVSPLPARFVVLLDGVKIDERADVSMLEMDVGKPGAYRVEVYLDKLGQPFDKMPWIISNPIYVRY